MYAYKKAILSIIFLFCINNDYIKPREQSLGFYFVLCETLSRAARIRGVHTTRREVAQWIIRSM